jgi:bifunctional N-acetylglucosamine-1-phosphate-uridyltransferase/glucosamine-1-phosphate-acetyltransferase GlmU-like protein
MISSNSIAENTEIVILAAGDSSRMGTDSPKALTQLKGESFISRILETLSPLSVEPVIVVGHKAEEVKSHVSEKVRYAFQGERLGTGHALMCAKPYLNHDKENVVILYADMPLIKRETVERLIKEREARNAVMSMATVNLPDFNDWRGVFKNYGRIMRDKSGAVRQIKEAKDASPKEKEIKEVNPAFFCFESNWLWSHITLLQNQNMKREYYLTDMVGIACSQRAKIASFDISPEEALGANVPEDLEILKGFA